MSENESDFIKEFRGVYDYVHLIGEHVRLIQIRLEQIERDIDEITTRQGRVITESRVELTNIKESIVCKTEFDTLKEKLKLDTGEALPPLPVLEEESKLNKKTKQEDSSATCPPSVQVEPQKKETPLQEATPEPEKPRKGPRRWRFPFPRR